RDLRVVVEHPEAGEDGEEIVLDEIGITGCHQRQCLGASVGHVGSGVEPVLKEEKQAEDEAGGVALGEEVRGQEKRDKPLQQRASPEAKCGAKPAEQIMPAFVDDQ